MNKVKPYITKYLKQFLRSVTIKSSNKQFNLY